MTRKIAKETILSPTVSALVAEPSGLELYLAPKDHLTDEDIFLIGVLVRYDTDPDFVNEMHEWISKSQLVKRRLSH